jgi:hypothetical protein
MARLPTPRGDNNIWGTILNDYLRVAHNSHGTLKVEVTDASKLQVEDYPRKTRSTTLSTLGCGPSYSPYRSFIVASFGSISR